MVKRSTRLVPGYRIASAGCVLASGHHSNGQRVWREFIEILEDRQRPQWWGGYSDPLNVTFEFGPDYGVEYWEDRTLVRIS